MSYEFSYSEGGFVVRFKGKVSIEELNRANGEIQGHADFDFHRYQIVDLLDANLSSVNEEQTEFPALTDSVASETTGTVKVALVARESHAVSMVSSYVEHARQLVPKWKFGIFSTREGALTWAQI